MQPVTRVFAGLLICISIGCARWDKQKCCPVYHPHDTLIGSEAIRQGPCGPDEMFHGLKKTCWREWPAEWQNWPACMETVSEVQTVPQPYPHQHPSQPIPLVNETGEWSAPTNVEPHQPTAPPITDRPLLNQGRVDSLEPNGADTIDIAPSEDFVSPPATSNSNTPSDPLANPFEQSSWLQPTVPPAESAGQQANTPDVIEIEEPKVRTYYQRRVGWRPPKPAKLRR